MGSYFIVSSLLLQNNTNSTIFASQKNLMHKIKFSFYRALAGLVTYFIVGGIINYKWKGARGLEIVPHIQFWKELPLLIKVSNQLLFYLRLRQCSILYTAHNTYTLFALSCTTHCVLIHCSIRGAARMYSMRHRLYLRFLIQYLAMSYDVREC